MQLEEIIQMRAYAHYDSIYLGILLTASFACAVIGAGGSLLGAIGNLIVLSVPFFVAYRVRKFRVEARGDHMTYTMALTYCLRVFIGGGIFFAVCQWLYMQFLDGGRLLNAYRSMMSMPEMQPVLKVYGLSQQQVDDALAQMFSPLTLASYSFIMACIAGGIGSIIIAAIMKK